MVSYDQSNVLVNLQRFQLLFPFLQQRKLSQGQGDQDSKTSDLSTNATNNNNNNNNDKRDLVKELSRFTLGSTSDDIFKKYSEKEKNLEQSKF
ncbi:hypothetical protein RFI_05900 [Reticulomyxa filosa]|uniref:Uncharacterized protein n=1 Tax=Reticulomyxa filosa TaxID=46433 RepID=X6NZ22_RETFI|nr:hypothetical protein RFI_05900 [Reticulomyxa filosa]|eukprot:ETO31221.1 hypothetical protein RFI_05900 [Reticulomyxa filosa]